MFEVFVFLSLLVSVVGYMIYDRVVATRRIRRASAEGFMPSKGVSISLASATVAAMGLTLAAIEYFEPVKSTTASRRIPLALAERVLGAHGPAMLFAAVGLAFLVLAVVTHPKWLAWKRARTKSAV